MYSYIFNGLLLFLSIHMGVPGGAMMLGKLPVPECPTNLDQRRARATALAVDAALYLDIFSLVYHFSFPSPSLWQTARYRLKYCLKGPLSPKQPTSSIHMSATYKTLITDKTVSPF